MFQFKNAYKFTRLVHSGNIFVKRYSNMYIRYFTMSLGVAENMIPSTTK